ncbi:MAG: VIT and VWA domain-containing protein [Bacteroidales bacterium]|nr:VIT and VWA domain-containing protein [Bacteroidales bacterium]
MKTTEIIKNCKITFMISVILLVSFEAIAQLETPENKTLSPYFFVQSDDLGLDQLPLKSTKTEVEIAGVIADVKVKQVYKNEGTRSLEAIYIFPASTQAAVYGLKMTIGERTIIAKIEESEKARQDYEEARQHGKTASLLEQKRPNVFQMSVANIMPGDKIVVELSYTELIVPDEGVYEFVYPTVVGPRYSNTPEDIASANEMWVSNPYTHEGENPFYTFDLSVNLMAGLPVNDVVCTSHDIDINFAGKNEVFVSLLDSEKFGGNRDFILKYKLQGNQIESGLLLFEGEKENFFLAMIQPPRHIKPEDIPPREYVFIVDVSGSMSGFPLEVSKTLLKDLIGKLRPSDKFNVLLFAGSSRLFSPNSLIANELNIQKAINFLDNQRGGGGTELLPALRKALAIKGAEDFARTIIIATDGYVTVEKEAYDLIRRNLGKANFFTFGIGSSVNRYILEGMAHVGKGVPFVAINQKEAKEKAAKFRKYVENPVLTNISMSFNGFDVYDVEPLEVPDVFSERPVLVYGKYKGSPTGSIELTGNTGNKMFQQKLEVNKFKNHKSNSALKYLWAREKIRILDDYTNLAQNSEHVNEITSLGLKYNLLTAYTSFIAIDSETRK